jgi:hypothetical protein
MFCATSFIDHRKYVSNKKTYASIQRMSDDLCKEFGLSVIKPGQSKGKHYAEYVADKTGGGSWKSKLKIAIDTTIIQSKDFNDFLARMEAAGYEVKHGKHISFRAPGQERFTRAKTLGEDYTEDAITTRISGEYVKNTAAKTAPGKQDKAANMLIDIESSIKAQQSVGYSRWAKINNLKEAAKTLNFLTENGLLQYADLETKVAEVATAFGDTNAVLKAAEKKLTDMAVLMKHIQTYQQTKPAYDGLKTAKNKDAYSREHEREIILHEAVVRAIKAVRPNGGKLPSLTTLQTEYAKLSERKDALRSEYGKLKKQAREYGIIKRNVDSILGEPDGREKAKRREMQR